MDTTEKNTARLKVREAGLEDVPAISKLVERVYPGMPPYPDAMLRGQINAFPEGVWVAELGEDITVVVERLLREGYSAAVISVLVNVAKYRPSLWWCSSPSPPSELV